MSHRNAQRNARDDPGITAMELLFGPDFAVRELPEYHYGVDARSHTKPRNYREAREGPLFGKDVPIRRLWFNRESDGVGGARLATLELVRVWDHDPSDEDLEFDVPLLQVGQNADGSRLSDEDGVEEALVLQCDLSRVRADCIKRYTVDRNGEGLYEWWELQYTLLLTLDRSWTLSQLRLQLEVECDGDQYHLVEEWI